MNIEQIRVGDKAVLRVSGRMNAENGPQFEQACQASIAEGSQILVADLSALGYISSMGLRSIIVVAKKLKEHGGELRISGLTGLVRQVFEITRMEQIVPLHPSLEAALER